MSNEKIETVQDGATGYIMARVHEYAMATLQVHIKQRDTGECFDERKHQQALWCAIGDMINNETEMLMDACSDHAEKSGYWSKKFHEAETQLNSKLIINEVVSEHEDGNEPNTMSWILKTPMKVGTKIWGVSYE